MTIAEARDYVRQFARNAGSSSDYADGDVDRAIQTVADDFIRFTRCTKTVSSLTLTADANALPAFPTGFKPERIIRAWVLLSGALEGRLTVIDHDALLDLRIDDDDSTDLPTHLAFDSWTTGEVYPKPDEAYTVKIQWFEPFTTYTAGTATTSTTLNLPDDFLRPLLIYGATALLQHTSPEHAFASASWAKYLGFRQEMRGAGSLGAKVGIRNDLED